MKSGIRHRYLSKMKNILFYKVEAAAIFDVCVVLFFSFIIIIKIMLERTWRDDYLFYCNV